MSGEGSRLTEQGLRVLAILRSMDRRGVHLYGLEISRWTGVTPGTLYPMLDRFVDGGLVTRYFETDPVVPHRTPRQYCVLTDAGRRRIDKSLSDLLDLRSGRWPEDLQGD